MHKYCPCLQGEISSGPAVVATCCRTVVLKDFFHIPPIQTHSLSIPPQQRLQIILAKIAHYLLWINKRVLGTKQTFVTSFTTVKPACNSKLVWLLLDRRMVRLIMELVGNHNFTLTIANGKQNRLPHFKIGVLQGSGLAHLLFNILTSYILTCI